jgi:hypothetical protein
MNKTQIGLYQNMLRTYPDVLSKTLAYNLINSGQIVSCKIGRSYKIAKCNFIDFINKSICRGAKL